MTLAEIKEYVDAGAIGVLILGLIFLYRGATSAGRCLANRLFHEETGLVTQWVKSQQAFVAAVQQQNEQTHLALDRHTDSVLSLCLLLKRVCREKIGVDVDDEIERVESLVRAADNRRG